MYFEGGMNASDDECQSERDAIASLMLAMGIHQEMEQRKNVTPNSASCS
jgi:hypothetical protein